MNLNRRSQVIVAIQIAGSAYAAITLLTVFPGLGADGITWLFYSILLAVSVFGFVSGLLYWAGKKAGYYGSIAAHALQIPMVITTALAYKLAFGFGVFLKIIGPIKLVELKFGASIVLIVLPEQQSAVVAVNLYALFALMYLVRDRKTESEQGVRTAA